MILNGVVWNVNAEDISEALDIADVSLSYSDFDSINIGHINTYSLWTEDALALDSFKPVLWD